MGFNIIKVRCAVDIATLKAVLDLFDKKKSPRFWARVALDSVAGKGDDEDL